jgi:hypothetical protein
MELVRPGRGMEEMGKIAPRCLKSGSVDGVLGNFMLSLELRSQRNPETIVLSAAQPVSTLFYRIVLTYQSLPPAAYSSSLVPIPSLPFDMLPPCLIPWPFRFLCPSRLLGYSGHPDSRIRERRAKGGFSGMAHTRIVPLKKELMDGALMHPSRSGDGVVGSVFVSIGTYFLTCLVR